MTDPAPAPTFSRGTIRTGVVLLGILLALGLGELAARAWLAWFAGPADVQRYALLDEVPASMRRYAPHPYLAYVNNPGFQRGGTRHDSRGFRGPGVAVPKPEGTFRIVCLGGSTTYTSFVSADAETYPAQLQRILRQEHGRAAVEVVNAGVGGYNSWETLVNLAFRGLDLEPDLVIVYHGTNEVHVRLAPDYPGDGTGFRRHWSEPRVAWWQRWALLRIVARRTGSDRQPGIRDLTVQRRARPFFPDAPHARLDAHPPTHFARNLRSLVGLARAHGVSVVLATWAHSPHFDDYAASDHYQRGFREGNEVVQAVGEAMQVPVFDFAAVMPQDRRYWHEGRHLNAEGAAVKAGLFAGFLVEQGLVPE